ncbi:sensory protein (PAS domain) [Legionella gratiana]|uniref:Sensory protein (PAS domain) n=1 Tax=Legionella gratiana TaxID=45066 RepID=A0A378J2S6_9GAMM|nr:MASE3 domain-containing protein [Legionella gratiana]KTD14532.1 sensory protein (PAS domain) [Legionella gratiana]STX41915.1 sensory protein (PAS domain) [Legionella gratiana]
MDIMRGTYATYIPEKLPLWRVFLPPIFLSLICILIRYQTNLLVFYTLTELAPVFIGLASMMLATATTQITKNQFVILIALAAGWSSSLDIGHILAYKGMNLLSDGGNNVSTQFWISARFLQAITFLLAIYFFRHTVKIWIINLCFFLITLLFFIGIFSGHFPTVYIEYFGPTWFQVYCEWGVVIILITALMLLWHEKKMMTQETLQYISLCIITLIASLSMLSYYKNAYDFAYLIGHLLRIFSFWFIYIALVVESLHRPFAMLVRTALTYNNIPDPAFMVQSEGIIVQANNASGTFVHKKAEELVGLSSHMLFHNKAIDQEDCPICCKLSTSRNKYTVEFETEKGIWLECSLSPINSDLLPNSWVQVVRNITFRKTLENERKKLMHDIGERVKELRCLYTISNLIALGKSSKEELLRGVVHALPKAFQFPEYMVATIESKWGNFSSEPNAKRLPYQLEKELIIDNEVVLKIKVFYCVQPPILRAIFLPEESALLDSVTTLLQNTLKRFCSEQSN